ncbi:MAG TPA: hypothetical protein VES20_02590 [Bryobacteraceae bacterium]|nr:hypothetical protein [Bryobacteraceae bacterium]
MPVSDERKGRLRLDLFDPYGDALVERVDVFLHHQTLAERLVIRDQIASRPFVVNALRSSPQGLYRLSIDPPSYLAVSLFVNIPSAGTAERSLAFAIDRDKVERVEFPAWDVLPWAHDLLLRSANVAGFIGLRGEHLYKQLDNTRRAGLLNILAKSARTRLTGGTSVLEGVQEIRELRGDRFFALVTHELREQVKNSMVEGLFREVSGSLHRPPEGFSPAGSFKTEDRYGNLQLTFFASPGVWMADIDIDDAAGLEHVFQVARNAVTGRPTHPYDIHQILLRHQEIDSGFRLVVRDKKTSRRRTAAAQG